jgi:hypothetical protein
MFDKCCKKCHGKILPANHKDKNPYCSDCDPKKISKNNPEERHRRKEYLVEMLGGKCVICGYKRSVKALSFHHKNPAEKEFDITNNGNILRDWDLVIKEAKKCELLCLNCHMELHNNK